MIDSIKQKLEKLNLHNPTSYKKAGVFIGILYFDDLIKDPEIIFTKRSEKVSTHSGEVSFPGGKWEDGDESLYQTALRESFEETGSEAKVVMPYTMFSLPHINQVHLFYLADLLDENFGPTTESMEVKLFTKDEILWDELAFPTVERTLKYYIEDSKTGNFIFRDEDITLWK